METVKKTPKEYFKQYIARTMEKLELAGQDHLKESVKREFWFLYKNLYENGKNGDAKNGFRK